MRSAFLLVCGLMLGGCAAIGSGDCGPDWYQIGWRDGRINAGTQAERYAARCGVPVDTARYEEGYGAGFRERPIPGW